ncbi:hypothetical protein [Geothrix sp. PMB-07]|uniref:hypothetical protein n=1 Tax=Geothrix sp. PMB-07 TaxID=3068640 RepID=UPI002740538D|nr:hypothetical protein [Geothrix sp. PMB-07]WLT30172.1 hypothetical protein Q9293_10630 [Geothrix sp. PMB-07]
MSNLIYALWRAPEDALDGAMLGLVADRIAPSSSSLRPHHLVITPEEALCLTGPLGASAVEGMSAHLGAFQGAWPDWHVPGSAVPEGTFALIRSNKATTELCSDFAGSRTLWYVQTQKGFFAATSQRALICLLEGFDVNRAAAAWFLSSGSLGPTDGWDERIQRLPQGSRLVLDKRHWSLQLQTSPIAFHPKPRKANECRRDLEEILLEAIQGFDFTSGHWAFPLSGGYDCRFILSALYAKGLRPRTMTWGLAASLTQPGNDAFIAKQLASHFGLPHEYLLTELSEEPPTHVVDAFLAASGGTTDQLFPYLDGLRLWSSFAEQGIGGVIRGDEGFGWIPVSSAPQARSSVGLLVLTDFMDEATAERLSGGRQHIPEPLKQREDETLATYRDRLYHAFRIPIGLAALNDVKAPFVEIASPLLSRQVLAFVREMPDPMRTDKGLFKDIAKSASPPIPYATMGADDDRNGFLDSPVYSRWLEEELGSETAQSILPDAFRETLLAGVRKAPSPMAPNRSLRAALKRIIPTSWVRMVRAQMGPVLPGTRLLALRASLICRMVRLLEEDSMALGKARKGL